LQYRCCRIDNWLPVMPIIDYIYSRRFLERNSKEGDRPVDEMYIMSDCLFLSRAEHVKFRLNPPRLCGKAKYQ